MGRGKNTNASRTHKAGKTKSHNEKFISLSNLSKPISKQNSHQSKRQTNEWTRNKVTEIDSTLALLRQNSASSLIEKKTKEQDSNDKGKVVLEKMQEIEMEVSPGENHEKMNEGETNAARTIQETLNSRLIMSEANGTSSSSTSSGQKKAKTAGLIIIGDEILKAQVVDTNSRFICQELYALGVKVSRISIIGDEVEEIAEEVRKFSSTFDFVFTTGGIGPTHDDMTYVGVAKAFDESVAIHSEMAQMMDKWLGHKGFKKDVIMRMAELPINAKLIFDPVLPGASFPIVVVRNVYVFPGVPQFVSKMFPRMKHIIDGGGGAGGSNRFHSRVIYVDKDELSITSEINLAVEKFKNSVTFGSYPVFGNLYYSTRLTMESNTEENVQEAKDYLSRLMPPNSVIEYDSQPLATAAAKVYEIALDTGHPLHDIVKHCVTTIEEALEKYGIENICICFNGGKDCTALLHLVHAVLKKKLPQCQKQLQTLCINGENPFPEMESFIKESTERYNLKLWTYNGPIHEGLRQALAEHPEMKAVFMGTRRSDPSGQNLTCFQMTDPSWPQVMRVSPMLDWSFNQVWQFLRSLTLPYCSLYDQGYPIRYSLVLLILEMKPLHRVLAH